MGDDEFAIVAAAAVLLALVVFFVWAGGVW